MRPAPTVAWRLSETFATTAACVSACDCAADCPIRARAVAGQLPQWRPATATRSDGRVSTAGSESGSRSRRSLQRVLAVFPAKGRSSIESHGSRIAARECMGAATLLVDWSGFVQLAAAVPRASTSIGTPLCEGERLVHRLIGAGVRARRAQQHGSSATPLRIRWLAFGVMTTATKPTKAAMGKLSIVLRSSAAATAATSLEIVEYDRYGRRFACSLFVGRWSRWWLSPRSRCMRAATCMRGKCESARAHLLRDPEAR